MSVDSFINDSMSANGGDFTPEQANQALEMAMGYGDTAPADSIEQPADTANSDEPAQDAPVESSESTTSDNADDSNTVVLARDGVHTIPYEKHVELRENERTAREALAAANAELEALRQKVQTPNDTPNTQQENDIETAQAAIDAGVDPSIFGDFDEEGIASGIEKLVQQRLAAALAPIEQQKQEAAVKSHWETIFDAHGDADSVVESAEFDQWRKSQPSFALAAIDDVLQKGTAPQIVELLDTFKRSTNSGTQPEAQATPTAADIKARAKEVINNTKRPVPTSLSDMPGHPGATSIGEQVQNMSSVDALEVMANWTPEQITQHLNSI